MLNNYAYLYIEDDDLSREIMQMIMENAMRIERLTMFEDSRNFLARLKALPVQPEIFLLDIHVTPDDGFTMLQMLRDEPAYHNVRIIALTASVMNEEMDNLQTSGFDGAIAKPLSIHTFPDLLRRIVSGESIWHVT
jgi:CheY-like chemotaxis protein